MVQAAGHPVGGAEPAAINMGTLQQPALPRLDYPQPNRHCPMNKATLVKATVVADWWDVATRTLHGRENRTLLKCMSKGQRANSMM
jgi:hypothetical protein